MTTIEFSMDGGVTWKVWCYCKPEQADAILGRLKPLYGDTCYTWRKIEVVPQSGM